MSNYFKTNGSFATHLGSGSEELEISVDANLGRKKRTTTATLAFGGRIGQTKKIAIQQLGRNVFATIMTNVSGETDGEGQVVQISGTSNADGLRFAWLMENQKYVWKKYDPEADLGTESGRYDFPAIDEIDWYQSSAVMKQNKKLSTGEAAGLGWESGMEQLGMMDKYSYVLNVPMPANPSSEDVYQMKVGVYEAEGDTLLASVYINIGAGVSQLSVDRSSYFSDSGNERISAKVLSNGTWIASTNYESSYTGWLTLGTQKLQQIQCTGDQDLIINIAKNTGREAKEGSVTIKSQKDPDIEHTIEISVDAANNFIKPQMNGSHQLDKNGESVSFVCEANTDGIKLAWVPKPDTDNVYAWDVAGVKSVVYDLPDLSGLYMNLGHSYLNAKFTTKDAENADYPWGTSENKMMNLGKNQSYVAVVPNVTFGANTNGCVVRMRLGWYAAESNYLLGSVYVDIAG